MHRNDFMLLYIQIKVYVSFYITKLESAKQSVSSALNAQVPECPSSTRVPKCLSVQVPSALSVWVPKCSSSAQMPKCLECKSVQLPFECPWIALWVPNFPLSVLQAKKVWNAAWVYIIKFLKTFQNIYFYITPILFSFLGNKMYKFYQILLARCNHWKEFQKLSLNIS